MKNSFLPHYFKKIGLLIFFLSVFLANQDFIRGFRAGVEAEINHQEPPKYQKTSTAEISWGDILLILGMLVYALAEEKIEDEFLAQKRNESFFLAFNAMLGVILFLLLIGYREIDIWFFPAMQLILFLLIFFFKKRLVLKAMYEE